MILEQKANPSHINKLTQAYLGCANLIDWP